MADVDILIRDGTVVDGTGAPAQTADVAIAGDRITGIGRLDGVTSQRTIDADGAVVTPGFVDVHTHLDAQLGWDPLATSSCWHGVTSIVIGNCGVTFAPCKPEDREFLATMMESVEDIPAGAILSGLPWDWQTYGGFLDSLERMPLGVNVGGMVGHCAVRHWAMGEASLDDRPPTADELDEMVGLVDEAMAAGALGFSSSRTLLHVVPDGRVVPGTHAGADELLPLVEVLGAHGRGVFSTAALIGEQNGSGPETSRGEVELFGLLSKASGRPATFGLTHTWGAGDLYRRVLGFCADQNDTGATVRPQTTCRSIGVLFTVAGRTPYDRAEEWRSLRGLDVGAKLGALRDPERRARLVAAAEALDLPLDYKRMFVLRGDTARYDHDPADSLAVHAERMGVAPVEAFCRVMDESDGHAVVSMAFLNQSLDAVAEMLTEPNVMMGLADAGAHVGQIMDASQPTHLLSYWVRDRGLLSLEEGVRRITSDTASTFGIADRGVLRPGAFADVNVLDLDALEMAVPELVHDMPEGAARFVQTGRGYRSTIVNGEVFMDAGEHTGALAGTVLRGG